MTPHRQRKTVFLCNLANNRYTILVYPNAFITILNIKLFGRFFYGQAISLANIFYSDSGQLCVQLIMLVILLQQTYSLTGEPT